GTVDGLLTALEHYGSMALPALLQPSIDLALDGFPVDPRLSSNLLEYRELLGKYPSTTKIFFREGRPLGAGETLIQEDLGHTLERIREAGREGFYRGRTAALVASQMTAGAGFMDEEDLSSYEPRIRPTLRGRYRGYEVVTMGLPSSGGLCLLKALQLLEPFDLHGSGFHSAESIHLITEALKRSFSMRAAYLVDPAFVNVPLDTLLAQGPDGGGRFAMNPLQAVPAESLAAFPGVGREGTETTHFAVIDREGMAVSVSTTLNDLFGCKVVVDGAGFFLNDEMDDFVTVPGSSNMYGLVGGEENMVEPGKRPLSSMSPTILVKNGKPVLILGARGGARIISAVLQVILAVVDFDMAPGPAVSAPRFHHQWNPDTLLFEHGAITPEISADLLRRGHHLHELGSTVGQIEAIYIDPSTGVYVGAPDPREGGTAVAY
ncbi:MAG TPA: gamma-glutamyltransferase, partial [Bacteroidota bacterium]|nr:gamma-glutamyltransferase [Bacteroidota bacterium]